MKKILLAFDGTNFSEGAFEFVRKMHQLQPILVTGVFTPQVDFSSLWSYATAASGGGGAIPLVPFYEEESSDVIRKNIEHFKTLCVRYNIPYKVHEDLFNFALPELKKETRFADVAILSGELFYKGMLENNQFYYLKDVLHTSECPVIVVPENGILPKHNILAYDGTEDSVYAIKQFAYLFPELAKNPTLLVYAHQNTEKDFPEKDRITELVSQHYPNLSFYNLELNSKKFFITWISERSDALLISGSFGRSGLSEVFRKSFVSDVLKDHRLPVFISHK